MTKLDLFKKFIAGCNEKLVYLPTRNMEVGFFKDSGWRIADKTTSRTATRGAVSREIMLEVNAQLDADNALAKELVWIASNETWHSAVV